MIDHVPPIIEVEKSWGKFEQFTHNALSTVKIITVQPGGALSLQYHHRRDELWVVLDAGAQIQLKRFAKGSILLQSAHFSTLRPTASASQHVAGFAGRLVSISAVCRRAVGSIISRSAVGDVDIRPRVGDRVFIPRTTAHRLSAAGDRAVRILEVSFGEFDEDDIVRLEDVYGRAPVQGDVVKQ